MIASLHRDIIVFDTAKVDGPYINKKAVAEALKPCKGEVIIAGR